MGAREIRCPTIPRRIRTRCRHRYHSGGCHKDIVHQDREVKSLR